MAVNEEVKWQDAEVRSPNVEHPVSVIAAKNIPYVANANRLQNLSIYLPKSKANETLVGASASSLPTSDAQSSLPRWHVHIHGGAWRDPILTSTSIEAAVAHAFSAKDSFAPIAAIISLNYTVSPYPTHPTLPYDPIKDNHSDPAREAVHPMHINDVLRGFQLLRAMGLTDGSYILSGHSAGACLSCQATLQDPTHWEAGDLPSPPRPAAFVGLNGLYDLPALVHGLGASHEQLSGVYKEFQDITFGTNESKWVAASPALFGVDKLLRRVREGKAPRLVVLDQSTEDQLVPMNQMERMKAHLERVGGMRVERVQRCVGEHAAPWKEGYMIWGCVQDVLKMLSDSR